MKTVIILLVASCGLVFGKNYCDQIYITKRTYIYPSAREINEIKPKAGRVIFRQTGGDDCDFNCFPEAKMEWEKDKSNNLSDIGDNFLIGGRSGHIYEGLGWRAKNLRYPNFNNDVSIAFIGNFDNKTLPQVLQTTAMNLLLCGVQKRYIDYYFSIYTERDLTCNPSFNATNGIVQALEQFQKYQLGGSLITCSKT